MEINFNLGSLKIVHPTLLEYLKKIQQNVINNLSAIRDEKKIATDYDAIELLTKAQGTLKMIGLTGLVKVLNLCNEALKDVKEIKYDTSKNVKILESCDTILKNVIIYLDILLVGEMDNSIRFFSDYEELAKLLGKETSIKDLFTPKLELSDNAVPELQNELKSVVISTESEKEKIIQIFERTQSVIKNNFLKIHNLLSQSNPFSSQEEKTDYHGYCKEIYSALNDVQNLKLSKNTYILFGLQKLFVCSTSPIFNDEINKVLEMGVSTISNNFNNIELALKSIKANIESLDLGDKTTHLKADDEINKEILYFIINVLSNNNKLEEMPVYKEVNSYVDIDFYASQLNNDTIAITIQQKNPEVASQIDKHFLEIKEELILITKKQGNTEEFLIQHSTKFMNYIQKLSELLNSTNTKELSGILNALNAIFTKVKNKELKFTELLQKEVSLAVVLVDYGINTFVKSIVKDTDRVNFSGQVNLQQKRLLLAATGKEEDLSKLSLPILDEKSKKNDERKAFLKIFQELHKEFVKVENTLDQFLKNQDDDLDEVKEVFKPLKSARGIFSVIGKPELSAIVAEIIKVWEKIVESGIDSIDKDLLKNSFIWVSGISLIIAAAKDDNELEANEVTEQIVPKFQEFMNKEKVTVDTVKIVHEELKLAEESNQIVYETPVQYHYDNVENVPQFEDKPNDLELADVYLTEAAEVLENMKQAIKEIKNDSSNIEEITNIRRYFHTLKGSGNMVGLKYLGEAGWIAEQTLNKVLSEELELTSDLIHIIEYAEIKFEEWAKELRESSKVKVDLLEFKEAFAEHNPQLVFNIDLTEQIKPELVKEETTQNIQEEEKITVGDKEISLVLYNMFVEESTNHISAMNSFIHKKENIQTGLISSDFMLHAHTLASISRTVNLLDCANIAAKIEVVASLALEKNINLTEDDMKVLCHAVESLEQFRLVATGVQIDSQYVTTLVKQLDIIQESLSNKDIPSSEVEENEIPLLVEKLIEENETPITKEESIESLPIVQKNPELPTFDLEELVEKLAQRLAPSLQVQEVKTNNSIDIDKLVESLSEKFHSTIESSVEKISHSLHAALEDKVNKLKEELDKVLENNLVKIEGINNSFKSSIEENILKVETSNEKFNAVLNENNEKVEQMNIEIKEFVYNRTTEINESLNNLITEQTTLINDKLESAVSTNLERLETVVGESLEDVSEHLTNKVNETLSEVKDLLTKLENEGISSKSSGDVNEIAEKVENQLNEFAKVLVENKYNTKEVVDELFNKIDNIEVNMKQVIIEQKAIQQKNQELMEDIGNKTDEEAPKAKKGGFLGLFGK